jgi:GAF domain-containing protein
LKSIPCRGISRSAHTILQTDPLIVNDLQQDLRFHDNPLVTEAPFIRFYAGYRYSCLTARRSARSA